MAPIKVQQNQSRKTKISKRMSILGGGGGFRKFQR